MLQSENSENLYHVINKFNKTTSTNRVKLNRQALFVKNMIIDLKINNHIIKDHSEKTLLMWIAKLNNSILTDEYFDYIYQLDCDILNQKDAEGNSAIKYAAIYNNTDFLRKAVFKEKEVLNEKGILKTAVLEGNLDFVKELINLANNTINSEIEKAMGYAIIKNEDEIYKELSAYNNQLFGKLTFIEKNKVRLYSLSKSVAGFLVKTIYTIFPPSIEIYNNIEFLTKKNNRDIIYKFEIDNTFAYEESIISDFPNNYVASSQSDQLISTMNDAVPSSEQGNTRTGVNKPDTNAFSVLKNYPSLGSSIQSNQ